MKKIFMMAIALMASTMTFAGDSDALKAIMKSKDYAEAAQLLKQNLAQLADNAEKAKAYNHLVDLAMNKVTNETGTIAENQLAAQMGSDKVKAYDTLGLADGICNAIENAIECNKYDQLPDAKGKVKPKFAEKNAARIWAVRPNLVNIGQTEAQKGNDAGVLKYWGPRRTTSDRLPSSQAVMPTRLVRWSVPTSTSRWPSATHSRRLTPSTSSSTPCARA